MKKIKIHAIVLCLTILLQCLLLPAAAEAVSETAAETFAAHKIWDGFVRREAADHSVV